MRVHIAAAVAALALSALALADPPNQSAAPDPAPADYPKGALAAGVEGEATLRCARNAHLALSNCVLVSESPPGQGFGDAALAMAARSPDNPKLNVTEPALTAAAPITVRFRLHPPSIDPDLTQMAHVLKPPQLAGRPSDDILGLYYPDRAYRLRVSGRGEVHCHVTRQGRLTGCVVVAESPAGQDFGAAASLVAMRQYRMTPMLYDGEPTDGGEANLTIAFGRQVAVRPNERPDDPRALTAAPANRPVGALAAPAIQHPIWLREPNGDDYGQLYPEAAIERGVTEAHVVMICEVTADGSLDPCTLTFEDPPGYGFGVATLRLARHFQMKAIDRDGAATAGRRIVIPVHFQGPRS